jgi:hypothetical protein
MYFKLNTELKQLIDEISALSGIQKEVIREVWEFTFIRWAEQLTLGEKLTVLEVPFLGKVGVKYEGDEILDNGLLDTKVGSFLDLSPTFRKLVGDIRDEKASVVNDLLKKKIENALLSIASVDTN